jgi:hypothetical protein
MISETFVRFYDNEVDNSFRISSDAGSMRIRVKNSPEDPEDLLALVDIDPLGGASVDEIVEAEIVKLLRGQDSTWTVEDIEFDWRWLVLCIGNAGESILLYIYSGRGCDVVALEIDADEADGRQEHYTVYVGDNLTLQEYAASTEKMRMDSEFNPRELRRELRSETFTKEVLMTKRGEKELTRADVSITRYSPLL